MLKNYFKVAVRNIMRHKALSFINISGLAMGMAACLLILQYVGFELSYDTFHKNKDQIYRIRNDKYKNGEVVQQGVVSYPVVAKAMKKDFPEVREYVRIAPWIANHTILKYGDKVFREKGLLFAEPALFRVFSFPLVKGNPATALTEPNSILLSESKARDIFGNEDPMGKSITFEVNKPFVVTGIFKDVPANSHLQFSVLVSYNTLAQWMDDYSDSWTFSEEVYGYVQLAPGTDVNKFQAKLADFSRRHYQGNKVSGLDEVFILQPLSDIHLHSHFQFELGQNGNAAATWGLLGVAILIMVIAWSNYINLATARFTERAKEIGVRKVIGATLKQLLHQFMVESLLVSLLSFALAVTVFILLNPFFLQWLGLTQLADIPVQFYGQPIWFWAVLLFGLGALVSGLYPVLVLPSYKTAVILKGKVQEPTAAVSFRKVLVVYQFAIAISLIAFTTVAYQQVQYMLRQNLGVNIDGTLVVWGPMGLKYDESFESRLQTFENEVKNIPGVKAATNSKNVPGDHLGKELNIRLKGQTSGHTLARTWVTSTFFDLYGMPLVAGRTFSPADTGEVGRNKIVLNEAAAKLLGFQQPNNALGKKVMNYERESEIVGVVTNHHQQSLHSLMEPIIFEKGTGQDGYFSIKLSNKNLPETLAQVKNLYQQFFSGASFEYFFLEDYFDQQYRTEHLLIPLIRAFSFFAIFISCLGLWGLVLHAFTRRTKEIGIRKVLGASLNQIVLLLSKDFLKLVIIAFVLATPVAYYALHHYLQDFAYRIAISWVPFVLAGGAVLCIALLTISFQAVKSAAANPVDSLRSE